MIVWREWEPEHKFFAELRWLDGQIAAEVASWVCPYCGGRLHRADYPRKVRGVGEMAERWFRRRVSFCCSREGCRRRLTPPSVRFWGRGWFAFVIVLVASVVGTMGADYVTRRVEVAATTVAVTTVRRWQRWWVRDCPQSAIWCYLRGLFVGSPPTADGLPGTLLSRLAVPRRGPSKILTP